MKDYTFLQNKLQSFLTQNAPTLTQENERERSGKENRTFLLGRFNGFKTISKCLKSIIPQ